MPEKAHQPDFDGWLAELRARFDREASELLPLFDTYAAEARFGRTYIAADLQRLAPGARILEVGAGAMLLSCQLVREGFRVTALEPTGEGFTHFERMRQLVLEQAAAQGCGPTVLEIAGEDLADDDCYDFAFSVNVMEHVKDASRVLARVGASLRPGAHYRFTCPNYLFPYEPHFNLPTLVSKSLTQRVLGERIRTSRRVTDPVGTWESLNWLTVPQVRRSVARLHGFRLVFNRSMLVSTLERVVSDQSFAARRSPAMRALLGMIVKLKLHSLFAIVPATLQPIMDCSVEKARNPLEAAR